VTPQGLHSLRPNRRHYGVSSISHELWLLLDQCWAVDPHLRPTMAEILDSPVFGGYTEEGIVDHSEVDAPAMCKLRAPFVFLTSRMKLKVAFTGRRRDWWRRTRIRGSLFNQHGHSNRLIFDAATGSHFLPPLRGPTTRMRCPTVAVPARNRTPRRHILGNHRSPRWPEDSSTLSVPDVSCALADGTQVAMKFLKSSDRDSTQARLQRLTSKLMSGGS
jgi:hypothetical protein